MHTGPCDEEDLSSHDSGQDYDRSMPLTATAAAAAAYASLSSTDQALQQQQQQQPQQFVPAATSTASSMAMSYADSPVASHVTAASSTLAAHPSSNVSESDVSSVDEGIDVEGGTLSTTSTVKSGVNAPAASGGGGDIKRQTQSSSPESWNNERELLQVCCADIACVCVCVCVQITAEIIF